MPKRFISADAQLNDALSLGLSVLDDNFIPDVIVGVLRGGVPIAIAIHELFCLSGHNTQYLAIKAHSYTGINQQTSVTVQGVGALQEEFPKARKVLLVDDVFDSGRTLETIVNQLHAQCSTIELNIRIATPWYKPERNASSLTPDYKVHETSEWLVFPHELCGLTANELINDKPGLPDEIRAGILAYRVSSTNN